MFTTHELAATHSTALDSKRHQKAEMIFSVIQDHRIPSGSIRLSSDFLLISHNRNMQDITDVRKINEVFLDVCMDADIIALNVAETVYI